MHHFLRVFSGLLLLVVTTSMLVADIRLPKIFSDKMVLQRDSMVRVWGTADADEELELMLGENTATTTADADGKWSAEIAAPPVGGPYELAVAGKEARVVFSDVAVGEVWLCSGQSNMQWSVKQSLTFESDEEREKYFAEINNPNLRLFTVPANTVDEIAYDFAEAVAWEECTAESVAEFSATAYFFALALQKNEKFKDMPIGLIDSSWGGTPAESWTSRSALESEASLEPLLKHWDENQENRSPNRPASLYNGMIAPIVPFSIRGSIWYQGESNVGRAVQYQTIFSAMIKDWRAKFGQGDFPFYYVQLAPFRYGNHDPQALAELWEAQINTLRIPNTAMAPSSDIGNLKNIHPNNKEIVGERLARIALAQSYGENDLVWSGPVYESHELTADKQKILLRFKCSEGLRCQGDSLAGFQICGEDREFRAATAEIQDGGVVVWSEEVTNPVAVRYLWDDSSDANLFNAGDLPALPFRTDDFELLSAGNNF